MLENDDDESTLNDDFGEESDVAFEDEVEERDGYYDGYKSWWLGYLFFGKRHDHQVE